MSRRESSDSLQSFRFPGGNISPVRVGHLRPSGFWQQHYLRRTCVDTHTAQLGRLWRYPFRSFKRKSLWGSLWFVVPDGVRYIAHGHTDFIGLLAQFMGPACFEQESVSTVKAQTFKISHGKLIASSTERALTLAAVESSRTELSRSTYTVSFECGKGLSTTLRSGDDGGFTKLFVA